ncbi:thymidine phosphorylase [Erysipelotrichaceae bacterium]|nr:thymidine phosphorylase [Erysipelotrichaceae bacterium]
MRFVDIITKKRDGGTLSEAEIQFFISEYTKGNIPDYQVSSLLMALFFQGMDAVETATLTMAMAHSGDMLDLSSIKGKKADKHSTGGVGDKTSLVLGPLVAAVGTNVAKMSGRGLGHTGGTIDKLEAYDNFNVELSEANFIKQVNDIGLAIIGQTGNLTPADKKLYALRDVTGTVNIIPLIASSIMSKKIAAGSDIICLDVKVGDGAFMKTQEDARTLAKMMVDIGNTVGRKTLAFLTNMDEPLGYKIGNSLELEEVIATLKGHGPKDLTEICLQIGSYMVFYADNAISLDDAYQKLLAAIENGSALAKFYEFISAQGADPSKPFKQAKHKIPVLARKSGNIQKIKAEEIGIAAMILGAGRETITDIIDHSVGIELCRKVGDTIEKDQPLAYIYSNGKGEVQAITYIEDAYVIVATKQEPSTLIFEIID